MNAWTTKPVRTVNRRLVLACSFCPTLTPFGSVLGRLKLQREREIIDPGVRMMFLMKGSKDPVTGGSRAVREV